MAACVTKFPLIAPLYCCRVSASGPIRMPHSFRLIVACFAVALLGRHGVAQRAGIRCLRRSPLRSTRRAANRSTRWRRRILARPLKLMQSCFHSDAEKARDPARIKTQLKRHVGSTEGECAAVQRAKHCGLPVATRKDALTASAEIRGRAMAEGGARFREGDGASNGTTSGSQRARRGSRSAAARCRADRHPMGS